MSSFWSWTVTIVTIANILACLWLIMWAGKKRPGDVPDGAEKDHVWDDDLRELNNPMPRWWLHLFIITIVFGFGYLLAYPGLGNFPGLLGWTQEKQHDERLAEVQQRRQAFYSEFEGRDIAELADDPAARRFGYELYSINCAGCHGIDARGAVGFPNLSDGAFAWGGSPEAIRTSITRGRRGVMPPFHASLAPDVVPDLIEVVRHWDEARLPAQRRGQAMAAFRRSCAACHGAEGRGNPALGAPDLTDDSWTWGGDAEAVRRSILFGRSGEMPAFGQTLTEMDIKLLSAWVYGLSPERE